MNEKYTRYRELMSRIADVTFSSAVLSWDQETYMPVNGADVRAQQLSTLAGIAHDLSTSEELGSLLNELSKDGGLGSKEKKNIELSLKDYNDRKKYTREFVELLSRTVSEAFQAWQKARKEDDFRIFEPKLKALIELKRKEASLLGYKDHPYDALMDQFEPGATTKVLDVLFNDVKASLVPFVKQIAAAKQNNDSFMYSQYPKDRQWDFGMDLLKAMGYDLASGRQDISTHPFTIHFHAQDVRVTTRINENDLNEMIWSCIHEGGHALYEQGLPASEYGLPSGEAASLGIHESQSRLWENNVGRSLAYWKHHFPKLQKLFPENLKDVTAEDFYKAMNLVQPSFIRTSADELTYHFHVLIRYEIEKALIEGSVEVSELPALWNRKYKEYLGIDVPSDAKGVLQDIHWSHGSFGYFATYSLGSFYAAQFFEKAKEEIPDLINKISNGDTSELLSWLRLKVHSYGRQYKASELCEKITGEKLNFNHFMNYARKKYSELYQLETIKI